MLAIRILFFLMAFSMCQAEMHVGKLNQNNDLGLWLEQNIYFKANKQWSLIFNTTQRFGDDYTRLWYFRQWTIAQYDVTPHLKKWFFTPENSIFTRFTIGPAYSKVWSIRRNTKGVPHWDNSDRPNIVAFMIHTWKGWELEQRMVGEYIQYVTKHYNSHAFYRHRAKLNTPWKWSYYNINPFFSNEWFFRSVDEDFRQAGPFFEDRIRVGIAMDWLKNLNIETWWQIRLTKQFPTAGPLWIKTYQLGLTFNLQF